MSQNPYAPPKAPLKHALPAERPSPWRRSKWLLLPNAIIFTCFAVWQAVSLWPDVGLLPAAAGAALGSLLLLHPFLKWRRMDDDWPLWWDFIYVGTLPLYFIALILEAGGLLISLLVMYAVVAAGLPLLISHAERLLGVAIYSKVRGYIYWPERL